MDKVTTKDNGTFYVDGKSSGVTTIDPQLKIYHDCDDKLVRLWTHRFLLKS